MVSIAVLVGWTIRATLFGSRLCATSPTRSPDLDTAVLAMEVTTSGEEQLQDAGRHEKCFWMYDEGEAGASGGRQAGSSFFPPTTGGSGSDDDGG